MTPSRKTQLHLTGIQNTEITIMMKFYVCETCGNVVKVSVGSVTHPMTAEHYIPWVAMETEVGASVQWLQPGQAPEVVFALAEGQKAKAVYAWCNLHGLWKQEL